MSESTVIPLSEFKPFRQRFAAALLRLAGWHTVTAEPPGPKAVIVFYPHTSNWDFVIGMLYRIAVGFPAHWAAKHTVFRPPLGGLMRRMGGIPVDRRASHGMVGELSGEFERAERLYLAIAPEGTRSRTDRWRSGFYHLALHADVPIGLAFIDYPRREIGVGGYVRLCGEAEQDLQTLREFYATKQGRYPEKQGEIRFNIIEQ
ncbi:MAG: lysophospholipid acyltransferase family protein [Rhodocyclaceae bacterium]